MNLQKPLSAIQTEFATVIPQIYRDNRGKETREGERERDRERDAETDTETDTTADRQTETEITCSPHSPQSRQSLLQSFCRSTEITEGERD